MNFKSIVVHAGQAHNDDVVAISLALALEGDCKVYRRDPTTEELEDPTVLVLDVGGRLDAATNCYDHHQLDRDAAPACAASLYLAARHPELLEKFRRFTKWFSAMEFIDSKGPFAYAKAQGLSEFPFGLVGALEAPLKELIEEGAQCVDDELAPHLRKLLLAIGNSHIKFVTTKANQMAYLEKEAVIIHIGDLVGVKYDSTESGALQQFRDELLKTKGVKLSFSVVHDDRGPGSCLYRFNDDPRLDFSRLEGREGIVFAHKGGFIAKTDHRLSERGVYNLVLDCIK